MLKYKGVRAAVASAAVVMAGCGEEGGKGAVCADFKYQEDAQAAYNAGAKQLDGDHDGVACESLPHRPTGQGSQPSAPPISTPATSYTSNTFLNAEGSLVHLAARSDGYSFAYSALTVEAEAQQGHWYQRRLVAVNRLVQLVVQSDTSEHQMERYCLGFLREEPLGPPQVLA